MNSDHAMGQQFARLRDVLAPAQRPVIFSGAGMSAESGISTFRGAHDSLWSDFDPSVLASVDGWRADPALVWGWYAWRMAQVRKAEPHAGYKALARWQARQPALAVITQNVDDLHQRAGISGVVHLHGELFAHRCFACDTPHPDADVPDIDTAPTQRRPPPRCTTCGDSIRPGVVWFGEALPDDAWRRAQHLAATCDVMVVVGTSAVVHPAALLPDIATQSGATLIEINPDDSALSSRVDLHLRCGAAAGLGACLSAVEATTT